MRVGAETGSRWDCRCELTSGVGWGDSEIGTYMHLEDNHGIEGARKVPLINVAGCRVAVTDAAVAPQRNVCSQQTSFYRFSGLP